MRATTAVLIALVFVVPVVTADTERGATVGANLGYESRGLWDAFWFQHPGGATAVTLSWEESLFPGADYDLHLYVGTALDDNYFDPTELVTKSSQRTFAAHVEEVRFLTLPPGLYIAVVMPWQTQLEEYTLVSQTGDLQYATTALGVCRYCY